MNETIQGPDPTDWEKVHSDRGAGKKLPPKGEYTFVIDKVELGRTGKGYLQMTVDAKVLAPGTPYDGFLTRFNRFNTQNWPGKKSSGAAELVSGIGVTGLTTDAEYQQVALALPGKAISGGLDWEAYDNATGFSLRKMENFPQLPDGSYQAYVEHNGQKVWANARIKYVKSAKAAAA